jgi:pimeloyl-ACP methyl ester carboxylesterase
MPGAVLVHGAWHGAWCWDGVVDELGRQGIPATAVELPLTGLYDDAAAVRHAIEAAGPGCVVVGHSYGGTVIGAAAAGLPVARLVFLAAFMVEAPEEQMTHLAGSPLLDALVVDDRGLTVDAAKAADVFYADADAATAADAVGRLRAMPLAGREPEPAEPAWRTIPSTYVVCTRDRALPVSSQRVMSARASEVVDWPTDHSPFLARPADVAALVARLLTA